jgi:hypothetical protein
MLLKLIFLIIWVIIGMISMLSPRISKFSYFCAWFIAILYIIKDVIS